MSRVLCFFTCIRWPNSVSVHSWVFVNKCILCGYIGWMKIPSTTHNWQTSSSVPMFLLQDKATSLRGHHQIFAVHFCFLIVRKLCIHTGPFLNIRKMSHRWLCTGGYAQLLVGQNECTVCVWSCTHCWSGHWVGGTLW